MRLKRIIVLIITLLVLAVLGVFLSDFLKNQETKKSEKVKDVSRVFTSKALEEFSQNPSAKPSMVAQKISDELNQTYKNPYDKKSPAYTFDKNCKACNSLEYDDNLVMIIITTYDKEGELAARTVIKPPSSVTYFRDDEEKK